MFTIPVFGEKLDRPSDFGRIFQEKMITLVTLQYPNAELEDITYRLKNPRILDDVPEQAISFIAQTGRIRNMLGDSVVDVAFYDRVGRVVKTLPISIFMDAQGPVFKSTQVIRRHEPFSEDAITVEKVSYRYHPYTGIESMGEVLAHVAAQDIAPGTVLKKHHLKNQPVIKMGNKVNIILKRNALEVSVPGIALDEGYTGDMIRVKTAYSDKREILKGEIVNEKDVLVGIQY